MLRGRANPAQKQRQDKDRESRADTGEAIAEAGQGGAGGKHGRCTDTFGKCCGRDLEACQGAAVHRAQQADRGIAQAELGLPNR